MELNRFALDGNFPDLIVLFETDMKTLKERISNEEKIVDGIELRGLEYLLRVQGHMKESLKKLNIPYILIDARDDIVVIQQQIYAKIHQLLLST